MNAIGNQLRGTNPMAYGGLNKKVAVAAELGRNPVSKHQIQPLLSMEMSRLMRDGTAEPVSRGQIFRREREQGIYFPCSADHEQDWQTYPVAI